MNKTSEHTINFATPPVVGEHVTGTTRGPWYTATWSGTYKGVQRSEWEGHELIHFFTDGEINGTPQRCFGLPVAHDPR